MRRVVIDTSVLVRAFLRRRSSDGEIYRLLLENKIRVYYSEALVKEFIRVTGYPRIRKRFIFTESEVESFFGEIISLGNFIFLATTNLCRDKADNEILGTAIAASKSGKTYLITGDKDLLVLKNKIRKVAIMTPQQFLAEPLGLMKK